MALDGCKLLAVYEYIQKNGTPEHPVSVSELRRAADIRDRRTIYSICSIIKKYREDLFVNRSEGKENTYYFQDSELEFSEALCFAVSLQACISVSQDRTDELLDKLCTLSGGETADRLQNLQLNYNVVKHTNDSSVFVINEISEAIRNKRKITFKYYHWDSSGNEIISNNGEAYRLDPISIIGDNDRWYLLCFDDQLENPIRKFRIDRIKCVVIEDSEISETAISLRGAIAEEQKRSFKSFSGKAETVRLKYDKRIAESIRDKFGEDVSIEETDPQHCCSVVTVGISNQFFSWVAGSGGKMNIEEPERVRKQYKDFLALCMEGMDNK